jgi:hypothetical protein
MHPRNPPLTPKCQRLLPTILRVFRVQGHAYFQRVHGAWLPTYRAGVLVELTMCECPLHCRLTYSEAIAVADELSREAELREARQ